MTDENVSPDTRAIAYWNVEEDAGIPTLEAKAKDTKRPSIVATVTEPVVVDYDEVYNNDPKVDKMIARNEEFNKEDRKDIVKQEVQKPAKSSFMSAFKKKENKEEPVILGVKSETESEFVAHIKKEAAKVEEVKVIEKPADIVAPAAQPITKEKLEEALEPIGKFFSKKSDNQEIKEDKPEASKEEPKKRGRKPLVPKEEPALEIGEEDIVDPDTSFPNPIDMDKMTKMQEDLISFVEEEKPKSLLQQKAILSTLNKSQMTADQKQAFADIKAQEIVENTKVLDESIIRFRESIDNAPEIEVKYFRDQLNLIRDSRPKFPAEGVSPQKILDILTCVGMNIERLSTLLGDLTYKWNLYEGMIDTIEDMWSTVSLQSSEQTRRGEGALQISDIKIAHNECKGLKAAYTIEMETLKQIKDCCAEQIKLIQIQVRLNENVIMGDFEGVNR